MKTKLSSNNLLIAKVLNKFGTFSYVMILFGSFVPLLTFNVWGTTQSISGVDFYGYFVPLFMFVGSFACALGVPKHVAKGIGVLTLMYLYYHFFKFYGDVSEVIRLMGGSQLMGKIEVSDIAQVSQLALASVTASSSILLLGFICLNIFIFRPYNLNPKHEYMDLLFKNWLSKALLATKVRLNNFKNTIEEKANQEGSSKEKDQNNT
ncbi:hypothetical protein K08M3_51030 [Vibrio alginolyticus]|jgi:hypothetical protein|uniref:Uncharacterized protein n=1 Tax=Vibrio alginolyticus TaxID=663 RepID=A0A1W6UFJ4_VIBAL|nr:MULTISPECIES: hypothetical protein [Vibrio harveyi group]ARP06613.1 hypothetical protein K04M1_50900 [Vibrio alginolyticus]ARP11746.1 hypothetical protein K04M3_51770 [Vibrio alginolyticus]ARP16799.1 hypothetical protein K04M5_51470 [Vibrio alginolyticus]ARP21836.1 hypothetical protein K05K4_51340 [Vibrio alginolyticus]ARP26924.1 hypothetical protein K06K5_51240 [Vibrio alginolyticus]